MANPNEWIEKFTGFKVDDTKKPPTATEAPKGSRPEDKEEAFQKEAALKKSLLAGARTTMDRVKGDFQKAMANEVKVKGKFFKQKMLEINGTQIDEAEFEEIDFSAIKMSPETQAVIDKGSSTIALQGEALASATIVRNGKKELLFTPPELEDEYWFPLTRERILPETFTGNLYSKTQKMLDETNAAYLAAVEVKRERGELTPKANRGRDLIQSGAELLTVGADLAGAFGNGTENAKLAKEVLTVMASVVEGGGKVYDKVKAKEYADASGLVLDNFSLITCTVLSHCGITKETITAVKAGFAAGGAAINAGKKFAEGTPEGATGGTEILAGVLKSALEIAASQVSDPEQKKALKIAAAIAPAGIKNAAIGADLGGKIAKGDSAGAVDCLSRAAKTTLESMQDLKKIEATQGKSKDDSKKIEEGIDKETKKISGEIDLAALGANAVVQTAIMFKKGEYLKALDNIVSSVGKGLEGMLTVSGLDATQAKKIAVIYQSAASAPKALICLSEDPPNVNGALEALADGVEKAFKGAAPNSKQLQQVGAGLKESITGLSTGLKLKALYAEGKYTEGVELFTTTVQSKVDAVFKIKDLKVGGDDEDDDGEDGDKDKEDGGDDDSSKGEGGGDDDSEDGGKKKDKESQPQKDLKKLIGELGTTLKEAAGDMDKNLDEALEKTVEEEAKKEANEEALALLAEAKADIEEVAAELSDAEKLGREAANIDKLIGKMQRDQMIMKIAVQVMAGGTAFLATFIPGMGAASAAIKMCAHLVAAAQRAQQLCYWVQSKRDFAAAQSALTTSSQNFVKNQADQFTHYAVQAAFEAAVLIGNVLDVAGSGAFGAGAAAGAGLKAAATAGSKIEEIIQRHKKKEELEHAWRITKKAITNPTNRKLGLRARALNPTLAKYSIAWGAVKQKDPLARNAVRACDLTDAVLENENANVDKVVTYLETFYEDDDKLYREVEEKADWIPSEITLTLRFWSKVKTLAVDKIKLENSDTGNIDGFLAMLKVDISKLDATGTTERISVLAQLEKSFGGYKPKAPPKKADGLKAFETVILILRKQVPTATKAAQDRIKKLSEEDKAAEKQKKLEQFLSNRENTMGELGLMIAKVEGFTSDDEQSDMQDAMDEAHFVITEINKVEAMKKDVPVQSTIKQLETTLEPLQNLIDMAELGN